ncbi:hypothetical protein F0562_036203 [Nyssa sinensis]|uniref:Uncharacterized protein n=1 Tax=Nyssa sinensis TaxID=561372 RepID=A0A5J5AF94_9ASTE|nr:hypothetical protein F0562_036203 [Nyssa sinensis]
MDSLVRNKMKETSSLMQVDLDGIENLFNSMIRLDVVAIAGVAAYNNLKLKKEASRGPSNESQQAESKPLVPSSTSDKGSFNFGLRDLKIGGLRFSTRKYMG